MAASINGGGRTRGKPPERTTDPREATGRLSHISTLAESYQTHEVLFKDSIKETRRLAWFLDVNADEELIQNISEACDFDRMKQEKHHIDMVMADIWRDKQLGMYRKGQVGDWKNWFTVAQNELFDAVYVEKMKNSQVQFKYTL